MQQKFTPMQNIYKQTELLILGKYIYLKIPIYQKCGITKVGHCYDNNYLHIIIQLFNYYARQPSGSR